MNKFLTNSSVYAFATENLDYLSSLDLKDKKVLTVGSSYDSAINCALFGSFYIDNFDINSTAQHYCRLKHEAIKRLNYDEFLNFFMRSNFSFSPLVYNSLKPFLPKDTQGFFDNLYITHGVNNAFLSDKKIPLNGPFDKRNNDKMQTACSLNSGLTLRQSAIFNIKHDSLNQKVANNPYLQSEKSYLKAQNAIKNLEFSWIDCDILSLAPRLISSSAVDKSRKEITYDVIILSNIAEYSHHIFPKADINPDFHAHQFKLKAVMPLLSHLNAGGVIMLGYSFASDSQDSVARNGFSSSILRRQLYSNIDNFDYYEINVKSALVKSSLKKDIIDCASFLKKIS